jgi:hypothetical protein
MKAGLFQTPGWVLGMALATATAVPARDRGRASESGKATGLAKKTSPILTGAQDSNRVGISVGITT